MQSTRYTSKYSGLTEQRPSLPIGSTWLASLLFLRIPTGALVLLAVCRVARRWPAHRKLERSSPRSPLFSPVQGSVRSIKSVPRTNDLLLGGQGEERVCSVDNIGVPDDPNPDAASQECLIQTQRSLEMLRSVWYEVKVQGLALYA